MNVQEIEDNITIYLDNLYLLSLKYPRFSNCGLLEFVKENSEEEKNVIRNLEMLYLFIKNKYLIEMNEFEIKYKDCFIKIGLYDTNEFVCFCQKIDFSDNYYDLNELVYENQITRKLCRSAR